jgi:hypothetical protein
VIDRTVVTRREWRWVIGASIVSLAITCVPYLLGWALETPERMFGGCILLTDDCYSYLAKMERAAQGEWLFQIPYTPEPHAKTLLYTFYLLLGKAVALTGLSSVIIYHVARMVFGLGLLATVYCFLATFTRCLAVRRVAWLMVTFGGGLGWLLVACGQFNWLGTPPLDFYLPEGFAFLVLYSSPHIAVAQSLLLWGILFLLRAWKGCLESDSEVTCRTLSVTALKWAMLAGMMWLLMGFVIPFYAAVGWAVLGGAWLVLGIRRRRLMFREGVLGGVTVLLSAPVMVYSAWVFTTDPVYGTWGAQNLILSPHPLHYLTAYGIPLVLAAFAVRDVWHAEGASWLVLVWVGVAMVLVYLPFNLQRRLVAGGQISLSLLAAWGAVRLWRMRRRRLVVALLVTMLPTNFILMTGSSAWMFTRPAPIFRDTAEIAALDWLAERALSDDIVLTAYETGNYLPVRAVARVFWGHGLETVDADEKERLVTRFFDIETDDVWRRQLLTGYGVDYVFWGPVERALGGFEPGQAEYLTLVYDVAGYAVFEVNE